MAKNIEFKNALNNQEVLKNADATLRAKALDALLKADLTKPIAVRQVIIAHKAFWSLFPELKDLEFVDNNELLDPDAEPAFEILHQLTAQRRVALGVETAADDVLVGILKNNPDEVRAYLASKPELGNLSQAHGWKKDEVLTSPAPSSNKSTHILTDAAIKEVQRQVVMIYLERYIVTNVTDLNILHELDAADTAGFKDIVRDKLKLQQTDLLSDSDIQKLKELITKRRTDLRTAKDELLNTDNYQNSLEKRNVKLVEAINRHKAITNNRRKFAFINQIKEPLELYNPASSRISPYQAQKIKVEYEALAKECNDVLEQIIKTQREIEDLKSRLPEEADLNAITDDEHKQKIQDLRNRLQEELDAVQKDLQSYQEIQANLYGKAGKEGLLNAIGYLVNPKGTYIPIPENVNLTIGNEEEISKGAANLPTAIGSDHFKSGNIPTGKIARFDVYEDVYQPGKNNQLLGSFTYTPSNSFPGGMSNKASLYRNDSGGVYKVMSIPKGRPLDIAHLNYAMTLVASLVNRLEEAPSKEKPLTLYGDDPDQLQLMWTALVLAGKYNSRFKFGESEILVVPYNAGKNFNAAGEKTFKPIIQGLAQYLGFSSDSFISNIDLGFTASSLFKKFTKEPYLTVVKEKMAVPNERRSADQDVGKVDKQTMKNAKTINEQNRKAGQGTEHNDSEQRSKPGLTK